jgi:hypothetical protein
MKMYMIGNAILKKFLFRDKESSNCYEIMKAGTYYQNLS